MEWIFAIVIVLICVYLFWYWLNSPRSGNRLLDSKLREFKKLEKLHEKQLKELHKNIRDDEKRQRSLRRKMMKKKDDD